MVNTRLAGKRANNTIERRERLAQLLNTIGIYGIKRQASNLGKQFNVSRQQIQTDIQRILQSIPEQTQEEIAINIKTGFSHGEEEIRKALAQATTPRDKADISLKLAQFKRIEAEVLERWGLKPMPTQKHLIAGTMVNVDVRSALKLLEEEPPQ